MKIILEQIKLWTCPLNSDSHSVTILIFLAGWWFTARHSPGSAGQCAQNCWGMSAARQLTQQTPPKASKQSQRVLLLFQNQGKYVSNYLILQMFIQFFLNISHNLVLPLFKSILHFKETSSSTDAARMMVTSLNIDGYFPHLCRLPVCCGARAGQRCHV